MSAAPTIDEIGHSPIERLPNELLAKILGSFEPEVPPDTSSYQSYDIKRIVMQRAPLLQLALCSKRLNVVTTPGIYRMFVQTGTKALPGFIRTLLANLERGQFVREIICTVRTEILDFEPQDVTNFTEDDYHNCEKLMDNIGLVFSFGVPNWEWTDQLKFGDWDSLIPIILCQTNKLEKIAIMNYNHLDPYYTPCFLQTFTFAKLSQSQTRSSHSLLSSLNSVIMLFGYSPREISEHEKNIEMDSDGESQDGDVDVDDGLDSDDDPDRSLDEVDENYFDFAATAPILLLDSVDSLCVDGLGMEDGTFNDISALKGLFRTKYLDIQGPTVLGDTLSELLPLFANLRSLRYCDEMSSSEGGFEANLSSGIAHLKLCLEELTITLPGCGEKVEYIIDSLAEFEVLKIVSLEYNMLPSEYVHPCRSGHEEEGEDDGDFRRACFAPKAFFPKSLEVLSITGAGMQYHLLTSIQRLIDRKTEMVPALKKLSIDIGDLCNGTRGLWRKCADARVELDLRNARVL